MIKSFLKKSIFLCFFLSIAPLSYGKSKEVLDQDAQNYYLELYQRDSVDYYEEFVDFYLNRISHEQVNTDSLLSTHSEQLRTINFRHYCQHEIFRSGFLHFSLNESARSFDIISKLETTLLAWDDEMIKLRFENLKGMIFNNLDRLKEALECEKNVLITAIDKKMTPQIKSSLVVIGGLYSDCEKFDSSLFYLEKALLMEKEGTMVSHDILFNNLLHIHHIMGDYERGISYGEQLLEELDTNNHKKMISLLSNIGACYASNSQLNTALQYANKAEAFATRHNVEARELLQVYDLKTGIFDSMNKLKLANEYREKYQKLEEQLDLRNINLELDIMLWENKEALSKIKLQMKENEVTNEKALSNLYIFIIVILALLLLVSLAFYWYKRVQRERLVKINMSIALRNNKIVHKDLTEKNRGPKDQTEIIEKISRILFQDQLYREPEVSLKMFAEKLDSNTTFISNLINDQYKKTFRELINELRIDDARAMLVSNDYNHYSIEGISQTVGYRTLTTFNKNFKQITGITPSYYKGKGETR